ncbi:hypothetical protein C2I28_10310 [Priestia megaterium]|uniref:NACHT domain-containing protein n=1 Tax=Priestia megaterium TaxID=1404 RepID=UPI000D3E2255|nr:DNA/RNA helicase domain-containing protein [Priestia megaterium]AWD65400.1 hypothetical protein C2I28_10310 [Priestia megaterium]
MQRIDWSNLGLKGESKQKTFEDLCMYLFCRELNVPKISAYENQPGIETEPVEIKGKKYGFQSKFFDSGFDWNQVKHSLLKAIEEYPKLDKIFVYSNKNRTNYRGNKTKAESLIEKKAAAKNITVEYVTDQSFLKKLSEPANLDLAQLFFGIGDELGFIKNSANVNLLTLIQSSEYISLPIKTTDGDEIENLPQHILSREQKIFLISGNPGSGKSVLINKLLQVYGGLDKETKEEMNEVLIQNNAVPVLINLKKCATDSFDNIIRNKKNDSRLNNQELDFIYLFDGLDELSEKLAESVLFQIYELSQKNNTKKIIFSCRQGNLNKAKARIYFNEMTEYNIADLEKKYIHQFFDEKKDEHKKLMLDNLEQDNKKLINDIRDILLVKLLWDTITNLDEKSSILDLFSKKIELLIDNPVHKKNLEELNLLNPKKQAIIDINQEISFENQQKFQFEFSIKNLQSIILRKFKLLDYKSVNEIINYIADLFFESAYLKDSQLNTTYIYQHRRYQEYFFTRKLKAEYEKKPKIIRELGVLHDREYVEELFLKYLRKEYLKENNIAGLIELNLFNVYLGNDRFYGVDAEPYINSEEFIPALVKQEIDSYDNLFEELRLKNKIFLNLNDISSYFQKYQKEKAKNYPYQYLRGVWENKLPLLLKNIYIFWKNEKVNTSSQLIQQLNDIVDLYKENKFLEGLDDNTRLINPFWVAREEIFYLEIVINRRSVEEIFNESVKGKYRISEVKEESSYYNAEEVGNDKRLKSFFKICLQEKKEELLKIVNDFSKDEFIVFLNILTAKEYLPIFVESKSLQDQVEKFVSDLSEETIKNNFFILFYKKFFNLKLSTQELKMVNERLWSLRQTRTIDLDVNDGYIQFSILAFIVGECSIDKYINLNNGDDYYDNYYSELELYASLFKDFVLLLKNEKSISGIVRDYNRYINLYFDGFGRQQFLRYHITVLWSHIFSVSNINKQTLIQLRNILIKEENPIVPFEFYKNIYNLNLKKFQDLVGEDELRLLEEMLSSWDDDYSLYVDRCFDLSKFFSVVNTEKANYFFRKGLNEGILRHGWRKDTIVSYLLTEALEVIWRNNWVSKEIKRGYAEQVFNLCLRLDNITDGDHTSVGPYQVIDIVSKNNDIKLAEKFKGLLMERKGERYYLNKAITSILISKAKNGLPIEDIEKGMKDYRFDYGYERKPRADYYEEKFKVYFEIANLELYTEEEKKLAFNKAYKQVEEAKRQGIENFSCSIDESKLFEKLCEKYEKIFNLSRGKEEFSSSPVITEREFVEKIKNTTDEKHIEEIYQVLKDYKSGVILSQLESWSILLEQTRKVKGNIQSFINYLKDSHYPGANYWTSNSQFLHYGLAAALKNANTRQEISNYLHEYSGHAGFANIIKAYEALNDRENCLLLFKRYLNFCDLLVN